MSNDTTTTKPADFTYARLPGDAQAEAASDQAWEGKKPVSTTSEVGGAAVASSAEVTPVDEPTLLPAHASNGNKAPFDYENQPPSMVDEAEAFANDPANHAE